jgi:hypothetical protein
MQITAIHPSNSNTLLLYQVLTIPDPIQVSSAGGDIQYATLEILVAKPRGASPVSVQEIDLSFVVGNPNNPQAGELTDSNQSITASCSDSSWGDSSSEDGSFSFVPTGQSATIDTNSLFFKIPHIPVNAIPGIFILTIAETASAKDQSVQKRTASFQIGKAPYGFFVGNLTTPAPIVMPESDVTLQWTGSQGAEYILQWVDASGLRTADVSHQNSYIVPKLQQTTTFYLLVTESVSGSTILVQRSCEVTVQSVSIKLSVNNPFVGLEQQFTVSWTSQNADECILYSPFTPSGEIESPNGFKTYQANTSLSQSINFTIVANNKKLGISARDQLVVTLEPPIIDLFQASSATMPIEAGSAVTLNWQTRFASQCSLDQGIGTVASIGETTIHPQNTTTVTLTCQGYQQPAVQSVSIHVIPVKIVSFTVDQEAIPPGQPATLAWTTTRATSASINSVGSVAVPDGSVKVTPLEDIDYILTCEGPDGPVHSSPVHLTVNSVKFLSAYGRLDDPNGTSCTIYWQTQNATTVRILDPWSNQQIDQPVNGSYASHTYIDSTQDFVITAWGPGPSPISVTVSVTGPFG